MFAAQNADVAQTSVGASHLRFMECVNTENVFRRSPQKQIVRKAKNLNICISLFGYGQKLTFQKYKPGLHQTIKYNICDWLGVRKKGI